VKPFERAITLILSAQDWDKKLSLCKALKLLNYSGYEDAGVGVSVKERLRVRVSSFKIILSKRVLSFCTFMGIGFLPTL